MLLQIENLYTSYNKIRALTDVSLNVDERQIVSIIGSNGAGKTTLLNSISSMVPSTGDIRFDGKQISNKPHLVTRSGIVHVPEGRKVFSGLTVNENLKIGAYTTRDSKKTTKKIAEMYELFPILKERKSQFAATLSGGEQQMLAIARGLMANPRILLLDEPSLGLAPIIVNDVFEIIKDIRDKGITVLLVEQNANKAMAISDYSYVLENGRIAYSGKSCKLMHDSRIMTAYLGCRDRA